MTCFFYNRFLERISGPIPVGKIAEKAVSRSVFLTTWHMYFECRINKNSLLQTVFFGDFALVTVTLFM